MTVTEDEGDLRDVLDPALRGAPFAALTVGPSGRVVRLNEAARRLLGGPADGVLPGWLAEALRGFPPATPPR